MNGQTIQVITSRDKVPQSFIPLDDLDEMKKAVSSDLDNQNNLNQLLNQG